MSDLKVRPPKKKTARLRKKRGRGRVEGRAAGGGPGLKPFFVARFSRA